MPIQAPSADQVMNIAADFGIELTEADAQSFAGLLKGLKQSYDRVDEIPEPRLPVNYPRTAGEPPNPEENKYNAWAWRAVIEGRKKGILAGKKVAIKDNICVAGLPMANGSRVLQGYVPEEDATVVTRILDAGGTIVGKTVCEDLCFSGGSHTSKPMPVKNPRKPTHSAGGSSSGSGAVVAAGEVPMALGGDQGGSIRMPSSWCGIYGLKQTHGLVPYTGAMPIEPSVDHCGPMGASMEDVARLLTAIAGPDGLDPRQVGVKGGDYMGALKGSAKGLKIAVVKEGFGRPESEAVTDRKVQAALKRYKSAGATVDEVSIPMHIDAYHIWTAVIVEGATEVMIKGNGMGTSWQGHYSTSLLDAYARGWHSRPNDMSETVKLVMFMGEYMRRYYHGRYHAKAQNQRRLARAAYDAVLAKYDVLAMPTLPFRATALPPADASREDFVGLALNMVGNTAPFDITGHPALTVPCGKEGGLPIGLMLIGKSYDEPTVIRAGAAFEKLGDWQKM
ncbi:MAG: amidase [Alphaproteobacteria bacterium]|nr:amidase [Alphaproteobacteria bacterium]